MALDQTFSPGFFRRLQQLKIRTRRSFLGTRQGSHLSKRKGQGLEFADFRAYTPGDDFRHIDWGVYGRTDRVYVRQFREEQDLNVLVILDCSSSMAHPSGENKFELAKQISLALAYVALTDGDSVTISCLGKKNSPKFSGPKSLSLASNFLRDVTPSGTFTPSTEIRAAVARHKIPGKCFIVSDLMSELDTIFEAINILRYRNFEIALIQVLAPSELKLNLAKDAFAVDAESGATVELALDASSATEYSIQLGKHIRGIEEYATKYSMHHLLCSSAESVSDIVLNRFLENGLLK